MLVLGRAEGQSIVINGNIVIRVVRSKKDGYKLAIEAPDDVQIVRGEIFEGGEPVFGKQAEAAKKL